MEVTAIPLEDFDPPPIGGPAEHVVLPPVVPADSGVRAFETGATRSSDTGRYDPEGFLSPLAIERYCIYMAKHQKQPDGSLRASDNWQKGLPAATYIKGLLRHVLHLWTRHRGFQVQDPMAAADEEEDLCAIIFNAQGRLHELVKARLARKVAP